MLVVGKTMDENMLTHKEACEFLGVNNARLNYYRYIKTDKLPFILIDNKAFYKKEDLVKLKNNMNVNKDNYLCRNDAAKAIGVSGFTLDMYRKKGMFDGKYRHVGHTIYYEKDFIEKFSNEMKGLFGAREAAKYLNVSIYTLDGFKRDEKIRFTKIRGRTYFTQEDLDNYLTAQSKPLEGYIHRNLAAKKLELTVNKLIYLTCKYPDLFDTKKVYGKVYYYEKLIDQHKDHIFNLKDEDFRTREGKEKLESVIR